MAWRPHGRAEVNPENPRAWATCDRCGFNTNHYKLRWQFQWSGFQLVNLQVLVCDECYDKPAQFLQAIILPPDPPPLYNVRPEPYALDEQGPTQTIGATLELATSSVGVLYLDLFDADPSAGGTSVLASITGSATRMNVAGSLAPVIDQTTSNDAVISFTDAAAASATVAWIAAFDAPTGGSMITSTPVTVPQTVVMDNGLAIPVGDLNVTLAQFSFAGQWDFSDPVQSGELLTY